MNTAMGGPHGERHIKKGGEKKKKKGERQRVFMAVLEGSVELSAAVLKQTPKMEARGAHPFLKQAGGAHGAERPSRHLRGKPSFTLESAGNLITRCLQTGAEQTLLWEHWGLSLVPVTLAASRRAVTRHDIVAQRTM